MSDKLKSPKKASVPSNPFAAAFDSDDDDDDDDENSD